MRGFVFFLILVLLAVLAYAMGWINFSSSDAPGQSTVGVTFNKDEVKRDVSRADESLGRAGERAKEGLSGLGDRLKGVANPETPGLNVNRYAVAIETGARVDVTVTRGGKDLPEAQLAFTTSPGSNLVVTGGKFEAGQPETTVTIEAPPGAVDGRVDLGLGDLKESVTVEVRTQPATMWDQNPAWPPHRPTYRF
ncbi:MAG TPA: hypothetical protein VEJ63_09410 [Planctomycetota bacterium]|nr:hypothetical protein [Planctomycetota bacterium]